MGAFYEDAPEVAKLVEHLTREVEDHKDLLEGKAKFACLYRSGEPWKSGGKTILARTSKADAKLKHFTGADFVITVSKDHWNWMKPQTRKAVIDHELMHCAWRINEDGVKVQVDNRPAWTIVTHDLEEFGAIVKRHGLWMHDVTAFMRAAKEGPIQEPLFSDTDGIEQGVKEAAASMGYETEVTLLHGVTERGNSRQNVVPLRRR